MPIWAHVLLIAAAAVLDASLTATTLRYARRQGRLPPVVADADPGGLVLIRYGDGARLWSTVGIVFCGVLVVAGVAGVILFGVAMSPAYAIVCILLGLLVLGLFCLLYIDLCRTLVIVGPECVVVQRLGRSDEFAYEDIAEVKQSPEGVCIRLSDRRRVRFKKSLRGWQTALQRIEELRAKAVRGRG